MSDALSPAIAELMSPDGSVRPAAAARIFEAGRALAELVVREWRRDPEFAGLVGGETPTITIGVAVEPETFARIRAANGSPLLARVPPEQDAAEFELRFAGGMSLDILTTTQPGGPGAIARFLQKFGEGIQQVEYRTTNVDRAARILQEKCRQQPVYQEARPGADGTRVNFFLAAMPGSKKVLIELYESAASK